MKRARQINVDTLLVPTCSNLSEIYRKGEVCVRVLSPLARTTENQL